MSKKFHGRNISIRHSSDVIKVVIFNDGRIVFRGIAPVNDSVKVARLLSDMEAKGVVFTTKTKWFG